MDDASGDWKKEHDLNFGKNEAKTIAVSGVPIQFEFNQLILPNLSIQWQQIDDKTTKATLDANAWFNFATLDEKNQPKGIISCDSATQTVVIESKKMAEFQEKIFERKFTDGNWNQGKMKGKGQWANVIGNPAPIGSRDPGHTFPALVMGLNSPRFGVYNCDQVYRMGKVAQLSPVYTDINSNKTINDGFVACVIDLTKNGSFSFHPNHLTVNRDGRNAILLFTKDKEIYLIDETAFGKLNLNSAQTIEMPMKNVTEELKSPSDLKAMLNI